MIIMLEGVDGSGKSTLAAVILKRLEEVRKIRKLKVIIPGEDLIPTHPNRIDRLTDKELLHQLSIMACSLDKVFVCDRGPLTDIIYRAFDEHEPVISLKELWTIWFMYQSVFIVVHCHNEKSLELMLERGDSNPVAFSKHKELEYLYTQIIELFNPVHYNLYTDDANEKINLIFAKLFQGRNHWNNCEFIKRKKDN